VEEEGEWGGKMIMYHSRLMLYAYLYYKVDSLPYSFTFIQ